MSNRTRTYPVLAVVGASLLFGAYASTSCIIPDHDIWVPADCGIRWYGEANGAEAYNFEDEVLPVLEGGSSWPRGAVCMTAYQDWLLKEGLDYECDQHTDETSCDNDANCSWEYDLICLPDSVPWQARWLDLVGNHQGLGNRVIDPTIAANDPGPIHCRQRLGGLLRFYHRHAA